MFPLQLPSLYSHETWYIFEVILLLLCERPEPDAAAHATADVSCLRDQIWLERQDMLSNSTSACIVSGLPMISESKHPDWTHVAV